MIKKIIEKSKDYGWILEPFAKEILKHYNINTPEYKFTNILEEAIEFARNHYPVVVKVVSPDIMHKSDVNGVRVGISNDKELEITFNELSQLKGFQGVIVEQMVEGMELIIGGKNDFQFGPVVLVGLGGIGVEIYQDTAIGMAPLNDNDIEKLLKSLKFYPLLVGFRGKKGINLEKLKETLKKFSNMLLDLEDIFESVDLNPVMCSEVDCFVADARIILKN